MSRRLSTAALTLAVVAFSIAPALAVAGDAPPAGPVSFIRDVAPVLVQNCIACHNAKKAESKYVMTTFALLAKGGQQGEGITLEPGDPEASRFVELLHKDAQPRMPWKLDPMPDAAVGLIERWVKEGATYDGGDPAGDWTAVLRKSTPVVVPESYPAPVPVTALAFSPDGSTVAASGYHELTLWKTADGAADRRLPEPSERVYEVAYSPDGRWLATAGGDPGQAGSVTLRLAEPGGGGKPVRELLESTDSVFAVAFSPDSKLLAAAGADRAVRLWEVESGRPVVTIEDHADWVLDLAFSPDGKRLASASRDKTAKVFDLEKRESLVTFPGHNQPVAAVAFSPDGKLVATAGEDNLVRLWNPEDEGKQVRQVGGFGGPVFRLLYTPDGKTLVACGADKAVVLIDPANGSRVNALKGHNDWVYAVAVAPDGKTLASGSWDGEVRFWTLPEGKPARTVLAAPGLTASAK